MSIFSSHSKLLHFIILAAGLLGAFNLAQAQDISFKVKNYCQSRWLNKPINIDGKATEYSLPLDNYDPKTKVQYSIFNDSNAVYFCFLMTDEVMQSKTLASGMEVWIDTTGKKKKQFGVMFPLASQRHTTSEPGGESPKAMGMPTDMKKDKLSLTKEKIECRLLGFNGQTGDPNALHSTRDSATGIQMAMDWDKRDILVYELKIPIKDFHNRLKPPDSLKDFGLTIHILAREDRSRQSGSGHSSSEGGGGMVGSGAGGMGRGGMHGSGQRSGVSQYSVMSEDELYHTKFRLSTK